MNEQEIFNQKVKENCDLKVLAKCEACQEKRELTPWYVDITNLAEAVRDIFLIKEGIFVCHTCAANVSTHDLKNIATRIQREKENESRTK